MMREKKTLRITRRVATGVAIATVAAMLASCAAPSPAPSSSDDYYSQQVTWTDCGESLTCTTIAAPTDWSDPQSESISLSLVRHSPASGESQGSLFVNPGGPGQSGVALVRDGVTDAVDEELAAAYDIIGFDPRGVGESTPVTCTANTEELDSYLYDIIPGVRGSDE